MRNAIPNKTYWFVDRKTCEDFFVEATNPRLAMAIAKKYFEAPKFLGLVTVEEAEEMGYDTY